LNQAGIAGFVVGLVLAGIPLVWLLLRRQRKAGPSREKDAAATHRRNQAIVEGAGEGVLELDNVGQVRYANPAAAKLLGYDIEELPGLDYRVLINTQTDDDNKTDPVRRVRYTRAPRWRSAGPAVPVARGL